MTIIEVEQPWPDGERKSKHQHKQTVDENPPKATVRYRGYPSVKPTPSSSFSKKANGASPQRTLPSHPVIFVPSSLSVEISSKSIIGEQTSINPSLTPTMPAEVESPPKEQRPEPTTKPEMDTNTEEPSRYGMQGDDGNIPSPRHTTRRSVNLNRTRMAISLKLRGNSSVSPPDEHVDMFNMNSRGMVEKHSTGITPHTLSGEEILLYFSAKLKGYVNFGQFLALTNRS